MSAEKSVRLSRTWSWSLHSLSGLPILPCTLSPVLWPNSAPSAHTPLQDTNGAGCLSGPSGGFKGPTVEI
jgi:hypothetical protein